VSCTSQILTTICDGLDNKLTAKSLYISVYQNRHSWLSRLKNDSSVLKHSDSINIESDEESSKSVTSSSLIADSNVKYFSIEIAYKKFIKMNPIKVIYGKKKTQKTVYCIKAWCLDKYYKR